MKDSQGQRGINGMSKISSQKAIDILSSWIAMEVLTPPVFAPNKIVYFDQGKFPWEQKKNNWKSVTNKKQVKVYYQVVVGALDLEKSLNMILKKYGKSTQRLSLGKSVMATCLVDDNGLILDNDHIISLSTVAWGIPKVLNGDFRDVCELSDDMEAFAKSRLYKILRKTDEKGDDLPLSEETLKEAYNFLLKEFGLLEGLGSIGHFAVKLTVPTGSSPLPNPGLMNSFYLRDLNAAKLAIATR